MKVPPPKSALRFFGLAVSLAVGSPMFGATVSWGNPNIGYWSESTNWIGGTLPGYDEVRITNGGMAVIDAADDLAVELVTVGSRTDTAGGLLIIGGKLNAMSINLGTSGSGGSGYGLLQQLGGEILAHGMGIGYGSNASGIYSMSGGSMYLPYGGDLAIGGAGGRGMVNQSGGDIRLDYYRDAVVLGADSGSGTYDLSGGTLSTLHLVYGGWFGDPVPATNSFSLSGTGVLYVGGIYVRNFAASNCFIFTGGTLITTNIAIPLHQVGGVLKVRRYNPGYPVSPAESQLAFTSGFFSSLPAYVQEKGGTLELELYGNAEAKINNFVDVQAGGTVSLAGTISVTLPDQLYGNPGETNDPLLGQAYDVLAAEFITNNAVVVGKTPRGYCFVPGIVTGGDGRQILRLTVAPPAPRLKITALSNPNLIELAFTNLPGVSFAALSAPNIALPSTNWTVLGPVTEESPGQYRFIDQLGTNRGQRFYRVRYP